MVLELPVGLALICQNPPLNSWLWRAAALAWMASPRRETKVAVEKCMVGRWRWLGVMEVSGNDVRVWCPTIEAGTAVCLNT